MKNYYQILGIKQWASQEEIKQAYLKLSKKVHPDVNSGDDFFTEFFKNLNEAYQVLNDDGKRLKYDFEYNKYFVEFNLLRDKEVRLQAKDLAVVDKKIKKRLILNGSLTLLIGVIVIAAIFLFLDDYKESGDVALQRNTKHTIIEAINANDVVAIVDTKPTPRERETMVDTKKKLAEMAFYNTVDELPAIASENTGNTRDVESTFKKLNEDDMNDIFNTIAANKAKYNNKSNCIRIIKSANSNVKNAFDMAIFLQQKGFVIAGRETTSENVEGVIVDCKSNCISVIIGNM
jgi:hypothetical protein